MYHMSPGHFLVKIVGLTVTTKTGPVDKDNIGVEDVGQYILCRMCLTDVFGTNLD